MYVRCTSHGLSHAEQTMGILDPKPSCIPTLPYAWPLLHSQARSGISGGELGHLDTGIVETGAVTEVSVMGRGER